MGAISNVLVTGASGFLGSRILEGLVYKGYKPLAFLRPNSNLWRIEQLKGRYTPLVIADSNDKIQLEQAIAHNKIEVIIHTATEYGRGISLSDIIETNVLFPTKLVEIGKKHNLKMFINTDSFFSKPQFGQQYLSNYTTSKRILESLLQMLAGQITIVNLRLEHVFGENDSEQKFFTSVLKQLITNVDEIALTDGVQTRDFIYVEDVVKAYLTVLDKQVLNNKYQELQLGYGKAIQVKEFVERLKHYTDSKSTLKFGALPMREDEIQQSKAQNDQIKALGWTPDYNVDTAIKKIILIEEKRFKNEN